MDYELLRDFELINEFPMIVKHMNLTKAAEEIGTTQSTLTKHLNSVEKELGVKLIERKQGVTRFTQLTPAGEIFLKGSCEIATILNRTIENIRKVACSPENQVLLTIPLEFGFQKTVSSLRTALAEREERIALKLIQPNSSFSFEMLRNEETDLVFDVYSEMADTRALESIPLFKEPAIVIVDQTHPLALRDTVSIEEIKNEKFASWTSNAMYSARKHLHSIGNKFGFHPDFVIRTSASQFSFLLEVDKDEVVFSPMSHVPLLGSLSDRVTYLRIEEPECDFDMRAFFRLDSSRAILEVAEVIRGL